MRQVAERLAVGRWQAAIAGGSPRPLFCDGYARSRAWHESAQQKKRRTDGPLFRFISGATPLKLYGRSRLTTRRSYRRQDNYRSVAE